MGLICLNAGRSDLARQTAEMTGAKLGVQTGSIRNLRACQLIMETGSDILDGQMPDVFLRLNRAEDWYKEIFPRSHHDLSLVEYWRGRAFQNDRHHQRAIDSFLNGQAILMSDTHQFHPRRRGFCIALAETYREIGNDDEAYAYEQMIDQFRDFSNDVLMQPPLAD